MCITVDIVDDSIFENEESFFANIMLTVDADRVTLDPDQTEVQISDNEGMFYDYQICIIFEQFMHSFLFSCCMCNIYYNSCSFGFISVCSDLVIYLSIPILNLIFSN